MKKAIKINKVNIAEMLAMVNSHYPKIKINLTDVEKGEYTFILPNGSRGCGTATDIIFFCSGLLSAKGYK